LTFDVNILVFTLVVSIPAHTSQNRLSRYLATLALFCDVTVCLVEIAINGSVACLHSSAISEHLRSLLVAA